MLKNQINQVKPVHKDEFSNFRPSGDQFGLQGCGNTMAHLMMNLVHGSRSGPMADHTSDGPKWSGPCLAHHPSTLKPRSVVEKENQCFGRQPLWDYWAHLIINQNPKSGRGPRGDPSGGGPMKYLDHLAHIYADSIH